MKNHSGAVAAVMAAIAEYLKTERVPPLPPGPSRWKLSARREMARRLDPILWRGRKWMVRHER